MGLRTKGDPNERLAVTREDVKASKPCDGNDIGGAVRLLIAHGVDANQPYYTARDSTGRWFEEYWTIPIVAAVRSIDYDKKYDMARLLVAAGTDANLPDSTSKTAWITFIHVIK